jgi:signal transduction histidine kinase
VIDDGIGFDPAALLADEQRIHIGIEGMRERATILGGTFELQSAPGRGTLVRVCVPCR